MRRHRRQQRIAVMIFVFMLAAGLLLGRVFYLQLLRGKQLAAQAVAQRSGTYVYASGRGQILDRNGKPLHAKQEPVTALAKQELIAYHTPLEVMSNFALQEEIRYHPGSLATHITGYIKKPRNPLQPQSGLSGLERSFNEELWGTPSAIGVIVDAKGKTIPGLGIMEWQYRHFRRPYNLVTTLDAKLQEIVEREAAGKIKKGAVIFLDPAKGDILAMASFPRLPVEKLYQGGITDEELKQLELNNPYINRAIMQYPTGSVFKVVLAAAALEQKLPEPEGLFICKGSYDLGDTVFRCYQGTAHGVLDLHAALAQSCNGYFIDLALRLGKDVVVEAARRFKLGQPTGIPLGREATGSVPTISDLRYGGDVANMALGQGKFTATPLQIARIMAIIANNGRDVYPRLVAKIIDKNGNTVKNFPVQYGARIISHGVAGDLQQMLTTVVEEGTAQYAFSPLYQAAGKSGTAEVAGADYSHSWFAAIVKTKEHRWVAVVFVEEWRPTNATASAVFKTIMEAVVREG